jgi:hypothetical protein
MVYDIVCQAAGVGAAAVDDSVGSTPTFFAICSNSTIALFAFCFSFFFHFLNPNPSFHRSPTHNTFPTTMATPKIITLFLLKKDVRIAVSTNIPMHV